MMNAKRFKFNEMILALRPYDYDICLLGLNCEGLLKSSGLGCWACAPVMAPGFGS